MDKWTWRKTRSFSNGNNLTGLNSMRQWSGRSLQLHNRATLGLLRDFGSQLPLIARLTATRWQNESSRGRQSHYSSPNHDKAHLMSPKPALTHFRKMISDHLQRPDGLAYDSARLNWLWKCNSTQRVLAWRVQKCQWKSPKSWEHFVSINQYKM